MNYQYLNITNNGLYKVKFKMAVKSEKSLILFKMLSVIHFPILFPLFSLSLSSSISFHKNHVFFLQLFSNIYLIENAQHYSF